MSFLNAEVARQIAESVGTPVYVYDAERLRAQAETALALPNAFGLNVRYAMKAAPNAAILRLFCELGLHIDASSGYEVRRALEAGVPGERISLSAQEIPGEADFRALIEAGMRFNACSPRQLETYGRLFPGSEVGVRFNPGLGSGATQKTNVGGPGSSFGIWHEKLPEVQAIAARHGLTIVRVHSHIGSGADPVVWDRAARLTLDLVTPLADVRTVNLGGGFKVARIEAEKATDLMQVGQTLKVAFEEFAAREGRQLRLEIEPGTFLVANAASLLCRVGDVVDTGASGHRFLKLDTGMTEILRPSLYGSQHPIRIFAAPDAASAPAVVVGHCCESGDLLSPAPGEPEVLSERDLPACQPGDLCAIDGVGAYCSSMSAKNYNSFPEAPEVLLEPGQAPRLIRRRQALADLWKNETDEPLAG
ncbi:MAG: diaminopimelate decarboxylase [Verrucomicrobiota bacterium]